MFLLIRYATDLFERLRPAPRNDWIKLECSILFITAKSRHCIIILLPKKTSHQESAGLTKSARFSQISKTLSNQQDSLKSARLPRINPTLESDGYSPTASCHRVIALHSYPQLRGLGRVTLSIIKGLSGLLRVCGLVIARAQSPFQ